MEVNNKYMMDDATAKEITEIYTLRVPVLVPVGCMCNISLDKIISMT